MDATARDLIRQIAVISAIVYMIVAAAVGGGLLGGTPVEDLQGGALDEDGSYLAPAGPAFSIWSVIYLLLIAYAVWQALPSQRARDRQRSLGWWIAATAVLNGTWLVLAQFATLPLTVAGIALLLVVLCVTFVRTIRFPAQGVLDSVLIDGATGLHLGWVSLATVANTAAWLTTIGPESWVRSADLWGVLVLVVVGILGVAIAWASRWRVTPGLALGWGLSWLAVGRLQNEPPSEAIGVTAIIVAVVVVAVPVLGTLLARLIDLRNAEA
jgi:hypothetical protein